ncbi:EsaB/YukD family protein [Actinoplanes sp. NPDC049265]|uniref:EsaB/YukD family protein n=1 Tax=Actinoplanes sp. NPDC049265 TaxID=3363902 RepID=UPI0037107F7A
MLDRRSRITVVGGRRRIDVALPSESPIGEYVGDLAGLCGQFGGGPMTPAWSLAPAGHEPWPIETTLAEAGVSDGQVLYLRDSARDPGTSPVVEDIEELVATDAKSHRGTLEDRGVMTVWLGVGWLTITSALVAFRPQRGDLLAAVGFILVSLVMLGVAWGLGQKRGRLPAAAVLGIAVSAIPQIAAAGGLLGQSVDPSLFWCGVLLGANLGALMALAAAPEPALIAIEIPLAAGGVAAVVLAVLQADSTQAAAAATVIGLALIALARPIGGLISSYSTRMPKAAAGVAPTTKRLMLRARHLLTLQLVFPAVALAVSLPALALSGRGWAIGLAVAAGLGLVIRSRQVGFTGEVVLVGAAGAIGLFSVVGTAVYRFLGMDAAIWLLVLAGAALIGIGVAIVSTYRPPDPSDLDEQTPFGPIDTRDRGKFVDTIGMFCLLISATLAMGVFGVFRELFIMGRAIIG